MTERLAGVLSEFAHTMVTDFPIQRILDHLVRRIVDIMPVTAAGVTLITPGAEPRYVAASNGEAMRFERLQSELDEGPCVAAYRTGSAISVPDMRRETRFPAFAPRALEAGMAAVFTFPLRHGKSRPLGALDLYRDVRGDLSAQSLEWAQTLADVAAAYLINAQARDDLQESSDRSREASLHDDLTGLPNRVLLLELLTHASLRARRSGGTSAVLFIDLNDFKAVNDAYGHRAGDELLIAVGERLTKVLRPGDTLARLSGDEFAALCEDLDTRAEADTIVARIEAELERPFGIKGTAVNVNASIGVASTGYGHDAPEELLHDADLAMYRAKRGGRNQDPSIDLREPDPTGLQDDLAKSLEGAAERGELPPRVPADRLRRRRGADRARGTAAMGPSDSRAGLPHHARTHR